GDAAPGDGTAVVTFDGDVDFGLGSTLKVEIGGKSAGEFDRMEVAGSVEVLPGADCMVSFVNGFQPQVGDEFEIITAGGSASGMFDNAGQGEVVGGIGGVDLVIEYNVNPNRIVLVAVEAPILGDINLDGSVDLLDVTPFVNLIATGNFQAEGDINLDGVVNLLDVGPFIAILNGG
ncbi:MAG: dockerin type I domain-containing protein, partial [Pseudomonadota bacterium]